MPVDWSTPEMLHKRVFMLSDALIMDIQNQATRYYAKDPEVKKRLYGFHWTSMYDGKECSICHNRHGKTWRAGQFMPKLPAHFGCRCNWDIVTRA